MPTTALTVSELQTRLEQLNQGTDREWAVVAGKLHKEYQFINFVEAFGFMTRAAIHAEKLNHHPEWFNVYKTVRVDLVTHDADGISELDFKLATTMDKLAAS